MLGLFRREDPRRKAFREEFEQTTARLRNEDRLVRMAVGHGINMATSIFLKKHSVDDFVQLPHAEKISYIEKLSVVERDLQRRGDAHSALGFGLFKMWLGAVTENDAKLRQQFALELELLGKEGNLLPSPL